MLTCIYRRVAELGEKQWAILAQSNELLYGITVDRQAAVGGSGSYLVGVSTAPRQGISNIPVISRLL